jgi:hypothetical protein
MHCTETIMNMLIHLQLRSTRQNVGLGSWYLTPTIYKPEVAKT